MNRYSLSHDHRQDLGTLIRDLARDAQHGFVRIRSGDRETARRLIGRIDVLLNALGDRTSTELYRWLENLKRELERARRRARVEFGLDDGEGSGSFEAPAGVHVGS